MKLIKPTSSITNTFPTLKVLNLEQLIDCENKKFGYKISSRLLPIHILDILKCDQCDNSLQKSHSYNTR